MVEIEISVLSRQCLDQWIPDLEKVKQETQAWERERNRKRTKVYWRFTIPDARVKLKRFYPSELFWSCTRDIRLFILLYSFPLV
jgi:hypothetical protein